ncbi:hypothetical protein ILYODFUR_004865 [Ilyodon furcidens]|uniref:Uncharacterized protein n=1 Tax=Ilyodon furcidens TaxID=33524 RepID=A0ABV0UET2_9TELE
MKDELLRKGGSVGVSKAFERSTSPEAAETRPRLPSNRKDSAPPLKTKTPSDWSVFFSPLVRFKRLLIGCFLAVNRKASPARAVPAVLAHSAGARTDVKKLRWRTTVSESTNINAASEETSHC